VPGRDAEGLGGEVAEGHILGEEQMDLVVAQDRGCIEHEGSIRRQADASAAAIVVNTTSGRFRLNGAPRRCNERRRTQLGAIFLCI
jgi:hypothetical protein